jgi:hypothetical protein
MRERGILFSAPMVRAILEGRKTQTRRVVKPQPPDDCGSPQVGTYHPTIVVRQEEQPGPQAFGAFSSDGEWVRPCHFGAPGDRLWVRESIRLDRTEQQRDWHGERAWASYVADGAPTKLDSWGWKLSTLPGMFLPRGLSRITLEVTGVRVERLQDISEEDAKAEGCFGFDPEPAREGGTIYSMKGRSSAPSPVAHVRALWESINGPESWKANPWVWVVEFKRLEAEKLAAAGGAR